MRKTLVLGASLKPYRFSNKAIRELRMYHIPQVAVGLQEGTIGDVPVVTGLPQVDDVHTITLYIGPARQPDYYDYIFSLNPRRIIFNPGTENTELIEMAEKRNIEVVTECTIIMLELGLF